MTDLPNQPCNRIRKSKWAAKYHAVYNGDHPRRPFVIACWNHPRANQARTRLLQAASLAGNTIGCIAVIGGAYYLPVIVGALFGVQA